MTRKKEFCGFARTAEVGRMRTIGTFLGYPIVVADDGQPEGEIVLSDRVVRTETMDARPLGFVTPEIVGDATVSADAIRESLLRDFQ